MPTSKPYDTIPSQGFEPVVQDFKCVITDITDETRTNDAGRSFTLIHFDCAEMEVIAAREPYTLPVLKFNIFYNDRQFSEWDAFKISLKKCGYSGDVNGLIGKRVHWQYAPATLNVRKADGTGWENTEAKAMQVVEIEGVENTSNQLEEKLVAMADGHTEMEFKSAFLSDMTLQGLTGYQDVANGVMQGTFLPLMVTTNKLTEEGGVYHKV